MAKTTVDLPEVLHRKLRVKAALENRSMNDIVIAAVKGYLHNFRVDPDMLEIETLTQSAETNGTVHTEVQNNA
jgi:plasmid stability protein